MTIRGPVFYRLGSNKNTKILSGEDKIAENIRMMLLTPKGTRVNFPDYGSMIHVLPFNIMDSTFDDLCYYYINQAIQSCMPEITVKSINITKNIDSKLVIIDIIFINNNTGRENKTFLNFRDGQFS